MSLENILAPSLGEERSYQIAHEVDEAFGDVVNIEEVSGGNIHYVYRLANDSEESAYLKIRTDHYVRLPDISTQSEKINDEKKALDMLSAKAPEYFPRLIKHSPTLHYLLLADLMPGCSNLEDKYRNGDVQLEDIHDLGFAIGDVHGRHRDTSEMVRTDHPTDHEVRDTLLDYNLRFFKHPALLDAARKLVAKPTQLLIGDLSPKNALVNDGLVGFCDVENSHQGPIVYDQAYALAHVLLHQESADGALQATERFVEGYQKSNEIDTDDPLLVVAVQGILLYRLANPVIPYNLTFDSTTKRGMVQSIYDSLDRLADDFNGITKRIFATK